MKILNNAVLAGVSLFALATPGLAIAQSDAPADAESATEDGPIIVTARRKDEDLQDVPLSVQAVTGNQLQRLEIRNFQDLSATVPGLQLTRAPNGIQNTVTMRGVSFNPTAAGPQTAVELYRNDVVTSSAAVFQALYDVGQIEVLRGPQGTLRGRASPSGSISIYTRRPDLTQVGGYASGSAAEGGKWIGEGALNIPIIADRLGIRVAGYASSDRLDVYGSNRFTNSVNRDVHDRVKSIRASIRAVPVLDVLTLDFNYETTDRNTRSFQQVQSRSYVDGSAITGPVNISSRDRLGIQVLPNTLNGTYKFYNWQAQLNFAGQRLTYVGGRLDALSASLAPDDFGGILANPFGPPLDVVSSDRNSLHPFAQETFSTQRQRFHEFRLQNDERVAGIFDYVIGYMNLKSITPTTLYTTQSRCTGGATNCAVGGLASMVLGGVLRLRQDEENSYYGNLTVHIGDSTEFSGGLRRISFDRISGLQSAARNASQLLLNDREDISILLTRAPVASFAVNDNIKHTIYMFSGTHRFGDNLMVYGTYGTAFRPGNGIVCARCNAAQGTALNAGSFLQQPDESSNSAEIGFKSSWMDRRLTFNMSLFRQKFHNFAVISPVAIQFLGTYTPASGVTPATGALSGFTNSFAQPNDVKVTGLEAEFSYRPSSRFSFGGNVTYSKGTARNGRVPCVDLNNDGFQDTTAIAAADVPLLVAQAGAGLVDTCPLSRVSPAPRFSGTFQSEYNMPVGGDSEAYLRGLVTYNGNTSGDDVNPVDSVSSYALVNMYLGIRGSEGDWDLSVFARNITNSHRVLTREGTRATSVINSVSYTSDYYNITTTAPREFGVSLRVAFGSR